MTMHPGTVRCPLLIGRDDLLELAERRLDDVLAGSGQFLLVAGEAGIGKSRFMDAIVQLANERGFVHAWGSLAPQDRDVPAASILDLARSMSRIPQFAAAGRQLLALREATLEAGQVRRRQLVMDVVDTILGAVVGPSLIGFEDLQWADDLSLEIIAELARRARDQQVLLCADYRTDEAPAGTSLRDWRSRLLTQRLAEEVRLRPLDEAQTALVTTLILDTGLPAPRDVVAAVHERTDGIPLHIEELLGALSADARANGYAIREAIVPETIEDAVIARLSHLSSEAQAVARAGAVIGRCFVPDVLAGIMDVPVDAVDAPLQELIDHAVLWPPGERGLYDFRHQLLRDAIYRSVPAANRRRFHARAGEFGAQLEGQSEVHSSLHYERAGLRRRAFETALAGARDAARLSAHREAFELYQRAVGNLPDDLPAGERATILSAASDEASAIEENTIADDLGRLAVAAYRAAGDQVSAIVVLSGLEALTRRGGRPISEMMASMVALLAELDGLPDSAAADVARADISYYLSMIYMDLRDLPAARASLAEMRRFGDGNPSPEYRDLDALKGALFDVYDGDVSGGLQRLAAAASAAEHEGREETGVGAYRDAAAVATLAMDYPTANRMLRAGLRYADSIEQSFCGHLMTGTSAVVAWAEGRWDDAASEARHAMADRGCRRGAELARWAMAYVAVGRGQIQDAEAALDQGLAFGIQSEAIELTLPPLWGLAEVALQAGDPTKAVTLCDDALARAQAVGERLLFVPFVVTGVRAYQAAGRPADAAGWLAAAEVHVGGIPEVSSQAIEHGRGLLALANGSTGLARVALEAAVRGWDGKGRIWEATWARLDLAHCLIRSNRYAEALSLAVEARTVASRLDSRPLADRADTLQRMARGRVAVEEPWRPLTSREFAVARLVGQGMTNAEIAGSLGIAPKTASSHVEHILAKLGASRRAEIAAWASQVSTSVGAP